MRFASCGTSRAGGRATARQAKRAVAGWGTWHLAPVEGARRPLATVPASCDRACRAAVTRAPMSASAIRSPTPPLRVPGCRVRGIPLVHRDASAKVRDPSPGSRDHSGKGRSFSPRCQDHFPIGRDPAAKVRCTAERHRHRSEASRHRRPMVEDPRARSRCTGTRVASIGARCRGSDPVHRGLPEGLRIRGADVSNNAPMHRTFAPKRRTFAPTIPRFAVTSHAMRPTPQARGARAAKALPDPGTPTLPTERQTRRPACRGTQRQAEEAPLARGHRAR
jgi:hypothetical protein